MADSLNGRYRLILRDDGDLMTVNRDSQRIVWRTNTGGEYDYEAAKTAPMVLRMQEDGNLVLQFDNVPLNKQDVIWTTRTYGHPHSHVIQRDDGTLVVRDHNHAVLWRSSFTDVSRKRGVLRPVTGNDANLATGLRSDNQLFELRVQHDGNVVVYRVSDEKALWATNTRVPGGKAVPERTLWMELDGNIVLRDKGSSAEISHLDDKVQWASNTNGHPESLLCMQNDGNLVLYDKNGHAIWSTNTAQPGLED